MTNNRVTFGVDELVGNPGRLRGARVGLVTNDAARLAADSTVHSRAALKGAGIDLARLFSPEHGLAARAADGEKVGDSTDPLTGLPVISLYGQTQRPAREALADLDAVLFDIPDIGARFYTYIWTLSHLLEACAEAGTRLVVLDRPNPIGGDLAAAEGPMLHESISTFVGRWNIPVRHSLTAGELARLWNAERDVNAKLDVVPCGNWRRDLHWPDLGLDWVWPSPNMRSYDAALAYPGTCLVEGTNLSEGRGTSDPFRIIGAPWIDGDRLAAEINPHLQGLRATPVTFRPDARNFAGEECGGVRMDITDCRAARPVSAGLYLIAAVLKLYPGKLNWMPYATAANPKGGGHFERLVGQPDVMAALEAGRLDIPAATRAEKWRDRVTPYLLY